MYELWVAENCSYMVLVRDFNLLQLQGQSVKDVRQQVRMVGLIQALCVHFLKSNHHVFICICSFVFHRFSLTWTWCTTHVGFHCSVSTCIRLTFVMPTVSESLIKILLNTQCTPWRIYVFSRVISTTASVLLDTLICGIK